MTEKKLVVKSDQTSYKMEHTTPFYQSDLDSLKSMVANSNHETIEGIADNWQWVAERLTGGSTGGLKSEFDDAVNEVLEHWSGSAADGFRARAELISTNIANASPYATNVSNAMRNAASSLKYYKAQLDSVKKPTATESGMDRVGNEALSVVTLGAAGGRDDSKANAELAAGKPTADVLTGNSGELSEGKERQLQGAIVMEYLGTAYRNNAKSIGTPQAGVGEKDEIPPTDSSTPITPVVPIPTAMGGPSATSSSVKLPTANSSGMTSPNTVASPQTDGISGGIGSSSTPKSPTSIAGIGSGGGSTSIGTGLDSFGTGTAGTSIGGGGGSLGGGGGVGSVGGGVGSTSLGSMGSGTSGMAAAAGVSGSTLGAGATGRTSGTGAGRTGSGAGRMGTPGMGGAAGAGKGGSAGGVTGRGALARQKGGVVGAAKGKTGTGTQGGSGLHRSRGGTQAGTGTGKSGRGMAGAPGAHGRGKGDEEGREGQRPDYLIEDEETWTTERNVAPRVIE